MCVQKEVEEEMQARVGPVSDLLGWVKGLQGRSLGPNAESSLAAQQVLLYVLYKYILFDALQMNALQKIDHVFSFPLHGIP